MKRSWRALALALVGAVAATLVVSFSVNAVEDAHAANASDFNAGNIISDENFYNGQALSSAAQVDQFLRTKNAGCSSGATCILNYTERTPTMAASAYCSRIEGRANESAASIIFRVGQACNISQKALIVLLEKEQSLISLRAPSSTRFERATGYACPDTAPCDAGFGGFFTQVYYGARAYQYYKAHPTQYRHQSGQWNQVLFNPRAACGSSQVFIQNNATAGLYNYTPYQPNAAAMRNLYGTGDSCSAYGNRNFWRLYTDWFGNPTGPQMLHAPQLVKLAGSDRVWLLDGTKRFPIRWESLGVYTSVFSSPATVTKQQLELFKEGPWADRALRSGDRVWHLDAGNRHEFHGCSAAAHFGHSCSNMPDVSMTVIFKYRLAGSIKNLVTWPGGGWWYVHSGVRHQVADIRDTAALGIAGQQNSLTGNGLFRIPVGKPLIATGATAHDRSTGETYLASRDAVIKLAGAQPKLSAFKNSGWLWPASADRIRSTMTLPERIRYGTSYLLTTDKGLAFVNGGDWGRSSAFTNVPVPLLWGVEIDRTANSNPGTLVQQLGSSQVWLVKDGRKTPVSSGQLAHLRSVHGPVLRTATDTTAGLPTNAATRSAATMQMQTARAPEVPEPSMVSGQLLENEETGSKFIVSDSGLIPVGIDAVAEELGLAEGVQQVSGEQLAQLEIASISLDSWGMVCESTPYLPSDGALVGLGDFMVSMHLDIEFVELPDDVCATLPVDERVVSQIVIDAEDQLWFLANGTKRPVDAEWLEATGTTPPTEPVRLHAELLEAIPATG